MPEMVLGAGNVVLNKAKIPVLVELILWFWGRTTNKLLSAVNLGRLEKNNTDKEIQREVLFDTVTLGWKLNDVADALYKPWSRCGSSMCRGSRAWLLRKL